MGAWSSRSDRVLQSRDMHIKDFDNWNSTKKHLNNAHAVIQANRREAWWCSLGINVGAEIDGKNETFERPVLVVKRISAESVIVLPLSTKGSADLHHIAIEHEGKISFAKLSQIRTISTKRLRRKLFTLPEDTFVKITDNLVRYLTQ